MRVSLGANLLILLALCSAASGSAATSDPGGYAIDLSVRIPTRDGIGLSSATYRPERATANFCVFNLSPYSTEIMHARASWFASRGIPFIIVDSRGRGNSDGRFRPFYQEARDGYDITEWLAARPECHGKVAMWGGSYMGYDQWATLKEKPPHLATIVPTASVYPGVDFPMRSNIAYPYAARWLTYVSSRALQSGLMDDDDYWTNVYSNNVTNGLSYRALGKFAGDNRADFAEWADHPILDDFWDGYVPTKSQYAAIDVPILTITGSYDDDQPGALTYYRNHMLYGRPEVTDRHYLVIGPWDHSGTRTPREDVQGVHFGPQSLVDMNQLHLEWYKWILADGSKPAFLKDRVAYYVMGADRWRYAPSLEATTASKLPVFLSSDGAATDVFASGKLGPMAGSAAKSDQIVFDTRSIDNTVPKVSDADSLTDQQEAVIGTGAQFIFHTAQFQKPTEVTGRFELNAWIAIDQPDVDLIAAVYEITADGRAIRLSYDLKRARYRDSLRRATKISANVAYEYRFNGFTFVSRQLAAGSRLRLVIRPINSINFQKNYGSGGVVADETKADGRRVGIRLFHDNARKSSLIIPLGQPG